MSFGEIFWPVFAALTSAFVLLEIFHLCIGRWMAKRQEHRQKEEIARVMGEGFDPSKMVLMSGPPGTEGFPFPVSETSDKEGEDVAPAGQYL